MEIKPYRRKANYYETDQMGIIHHSNYIRWFEEARIDFMEQMGYSYRRMEEEGVASPVLAISCNYKAMVRFGDEVIIKVSVSEFTGVKMIIKYEVTDAKTDKVVTEGESKHCFTLKNGRPVSLLKYNKELYELFELSMGGFGV